MTKDDLFKTFQQMFPDWAEGVINCKKIGSKCIVIYYPNDVSYVFLYVDRFNWQFGTKYFRKMPVTKKKEEEM